MGMSEDEFVVLVEHAGLLETSEDAAIEFLAKTQLLDWLSREGLAFFTEQFLQHGEEPTAADEAAVRKDAIGDADTLADDQRRALAARVLDRLLEREWIAPADTDDQAAEEEVHYVQLELHDTCYAIRLPTTEAYKIYMEKEPEDTALGAGTRARYSHMAGINDDQLTDSDDDVPTAPDSSYQRMKIREQMWQDCFPMCPEGCKQLYFSFENPIIIMYSTLGLNLISNGISSVPAFSRELKSIGISAEDRTIVVGFLARAFPIE